MVSQVPLADTGRGVAGIFQDFRDGDFVGMQANLGDGKQYVRGSIVGGYFYSVVVLDIDHYQYLNNSRRFVGGWDFFTGVFKSLFFGGTIAIVSCYRGFHCQAGAEGVGRAATAAFVYSFVLIDRSIAIA